MRVPQVNERVKELPAQALRGVFAGIGQLLLITDKLRNKTPAGQRVPQARGPERSEPAADTAETAPTEKTAKTAPAEKVPAARDLDKTGNVRLLDGAEARASRPAAAAQAPVAAEVPVTAEATAPEAGATEAAEPDAQAGDAVAPGSGEPSLPLPNYDELPIASLRARLRNLDAGQVKEMAEYERAHAARADVIAMFERRIAKLQAEASEDAQGEADTEPAVEAQEKADTEGQVEAQEEVEAEVREEVEAEAEGEA